MGVSTHDSSLFTHAPSASALLYHTMALARFNGQKASVRATVDRKALQHHYEMCCIENMAAERPSLHATFSGTSELTSFETSTPFSARTDLATIPSLRSPQMETSIGRVGDPSKRLWPTDSEKRSVQRRFWTG
ncbi:hypothetical protein GGS21DRAFT_242983 [Xylaria nigripes]|nr:hypothetical protein GGS21DRAFT_242983 [Xylaria nigripes]